MPGRGRSREHGRMCVEEGHGPGFLKWSSRFVPGCRAAWWRSTPASPAHRPPCSGPQWHQLTAAAGISIGIAAVSRDSPAPVHRVQQHLSHLEEVSLGFGPMGGLFGEVDGGCSGGRGKCPTTYYDTPARTRTTAAGSAHRPPPAGRRTAGGGSRTRTARPQKNGAMSQPWRMWCQSAGRRRRWCYLSQPAVHCSDEGVLPVPLRHTEPAGATAGGCARASGGL